MKSGRRTIPSDAGHHTGNLLKNHIQKKRIKKSVLSRLIDRNPKTVDDYFQNESIQTRILWSICHALKHNFFADIAAELPETYETNTAQSVAAKRIAELEHEIELLKAKNEVLLEALKK